MRCSKSIQAVLACSLFACAEMPESGTIEGDAAPVLRGTVNETVVATDSVDVVVLWSFYPGLLDETPPTLWPADRVQIQGSFPSEFTLRSIEPPPDFVLEGGLIAAHDPHGSRVAEGYIVTVSSGTSLDELAFEDILGTDRAHSIAYVESDIEAGSFAEYFLGPLAAGFHLIEKKPLERDCDADPDSASWHQLADGTAICSPRVFGSAPLGFDTQLTIDGLWSTTDASGAVVELPYLELW